jgi:hypothetical protein
MKFDNKALALSALLLGAASIASADDMAKKGAKTPAMPEDTVLCYGVNSCKGQGACHGKVDTCAGKNNCSTEVSCAGKNDCKGKGMTKTSKKDCLAKKGTVGA